MASNLYFILSSLLIACEAKVTVFATGLGLLPSKPTYHNFLKLFRYYSSCDVRDKESFSLLSMCESLNITYSGDDVLMSFDGSHNHLVREEETPSLVIGLQNDLFHGDSLLPKILSETSLSIFMKKGIKDLKFVFAMHGDCHIKQQDTMDRIKSYGFSVSYVDSFSLVGQGVPVHKDSFFITCRYHIHLLASLWGCKGIALSNNQYYDVKHASVNMMGSAWNIISLNNAQDIFANGEMLQDFVETARPNNLEVKNHFVNKKLDLRRKIISQIEDYSDTGFNLDMAFDLIKTLNS